jgi:hypothetical protein
MSDRQVYSRRERAALWSIAVAAVVVLNGVFLYGALVQPAMLEQAMTNPLAAVFLIEALVLTGLLAYLFAKWQVTRLPAVWFVVLALAGSLAFAVPFAILWNRRNV